MEGHIGAGGRDRSGGREVERGERAAGGHVAAPPQHEAGNDITTVGPCGARGEQITRTAGQSLELEGSVYAHAHARIEGGADERGFIRVELGNRPEQRLGRRWTAVTWIRIACRQELGRGAV